MTMRLAADEQRYQEAKLRGETRPIHAEEPIQDFKHWRLVENRWPHNRIATVNHMLVLKREATLEDITFMEWHELIKIIQKIRHQYDNLVYNLPSMSSVKNIPHCHLYKLRKEYA